MPEGTPLDVQLGIYDHAGFWVDYFATGTIGTTAPAPQLCAVVNFPPKVGIAPIPVGILRVEQAGGFLRAKKELYQVVAGRFQPPGVAFAKAEDAYGDAQRRALILGAALVAENPEVAGVVRQGPTQFLTDMPMFSIRMYGRQLSKDGTQFLVLVAHFTGKKRAAVPFFIFQEEKGSRASFTAAFAEDGDEIWTIKEFDNSTDALVFIRTVAVPIASALFSIASAQETAELLTRIGQNPSTVEYANVNQAQQSYKQLLQMLRRG